MTLLGSALLLREDVRPVPDVERADALRPLELVGGERDEVRAERLDIEVHVRRCLDRVHVEEEALAGPDACRDLGDRLDRADLVVREHDADQDRPVREGRLDLVRIDPAVPVHRHLDDLEAELLEVAQRVADGVVLDGGGDDAVAAGLAGPGRALEGEVVRLGAAGGEHDLARLGAEICRDLLVGTVQCRPGNATVGVDGAWVPE